MINRSALRNIGYDNGKLKWHGTFEHLKVLLEESIGLHGKWSTPGGQAKKFSCECDYTVPDPQLTVTWYQGKQQTLVFNGNMAEEVKDKFIQIALRETEESKTPEDEIQTTTNADGNLSEESINNAPIGDISETGESINASLSSINSTLKPSTDKTRRNSLPEMFTETTATGQHVVYTQRCDCPCNMMTAEIEGIKLDIVVLQNQLQTRNKPEEFEIDTQSVRKENKKLKEIINSNTRKHENEIDCLRAKLNSLETTLIKVEEERDSLRTVLTLITQDQKHERNNMGRKIEDCSWQKVGNSNRKQKSNHNNHPASSASINRFELLSDSDVSEDEDENTTITSVIEINNEADRGQGGKPQSLRKKSKPSRKTNKQMVKRKPPTNYVNDQSSSPKQTPSKTSRSTIIAGDSILKHLQGHKMSRNSKVKCLPFPAVPQETCMTT